MPMSYLYGKKFVGPITRTILAIREELYSIPYHEVDWNKARDTCAKVRFSKIASSKCNPYFRSKYISKLFAEKVW